MKEPISRCSNRCSPAELAFAWAAFACDESQLHERGFVAIEGCARLEPWSSVVLIKKICLLAVTTTTASHRLESARNALTELGRRLRVTAAPLRVLERRIPSH